MWVWVWWQLWAVALVRRGLEFSMIYSFRALQFMLGVRK